MNARWCSTCEEWHTFEIRIEGDLSTQEEHEIILCDTCGTVAERRKLYRLKARSNG